MTDVIILLRAEYETDASGSQKITIKNSEPILCDIRSVGMREKYQAMSINRNPEIVAVLSDYWDYNDEQYALYDGQVYVIIRTYRTGVCIELTLERTHDLEGMI